MVAVHLDPRITARVDPSDVVQEALAEAFQRLPRYIERRPVSFYPWLRKIAWQRLMKLHRSHIAAGRRSVRREDAATVRLPDESVAKLAERLAASGTAPSERLVQEEVRERVRAALDELSPNDRELLVMRYLEHMPLKEISEVLAITPAAAKMRHARALVRLEQLLGELD
jgi:RNA polymerase sigma-70 factor (ECF subfamily)